MMARLRKYLAQRRLEADRAKRLAKVPEWQKRRAAALRGISRTDPSTAPADLLACHQARVPIYGGSL